MSPEQRERVERNYERWRTMTPDQRQQAREAWRQRRQQRGDDDGPRGDERPGRGGFGAGGPGPGAPGGARPGR